MALLPVAVWGLEVPAGDMAVSSRPDIPSAYRITMAAIDPSEEGRSTLKIMRLPLQYESDDEEFDADEMEAMLAEDSEDSSDDEAGPSDPTKTKSARKAAAVAQIKELLEEEDMDVDGEVDGEIDDESDDDDLDGAEIEEFVVCTLDSEKQYQQTLDIVVGENEQMWFKVTGKSSIYLTGNYVETADDEYESDDEDEYDLEPEEDEELDELDTLSDRVVEIEEEVPALAKVDKGKKRAVEEDLDGMIAKESKKAKKQKKEAETNGKKVAFAKEIEQGPTPSQPSTAKSISVKTVQGVTLDDRKIGSGPVIKKGDRVGIRYIGKLKDGKVFDSNKKGKPFTFKAGANEVVKGMDIGVMGMGVGGERRVIIPASLGYGSKSLPDIPANSQLTFDIKVVEVNKGK